MRYLLDTFKLVPGPNLISFHSPKNAKVHLLKRKCQVAIQLPWELSTAPGRIHWGKGEIPPHQKDGMDIPQVSYRLLLVPTKKTENSENSKNHLYFFGNASRSQKKNLEFQAFHWEETTYSSAVLLPCGGWSAGGDTKNTSTPTSFAIDVCLGPRRMLMAPLQSTMEKPRPSCNRKGGRSFKSQTGSPPKDGETWSAWWSSFPHIEVGSRRMIPCGMTIQVKSRWFRKNTKFICKCPKTKVTWTYISSFSRLAISMMWTSKNPLEIVCWDAHPLRNHHHFAKFRVPPSLLNIIKINI